MEQKMSEQDLVLNLKAAGFEKEMIENYLTCWNEGRVDRQLELLSKKRKCLLEQVHREEKKIDCLDYLVYQICKGRDIV